MMQGKSNVLSGVLAVAIGVSLMAGGCTGPAKKPTVPNRNYGTPGGNLTGTSLPGPSRVMPSPARTIPGPTVPAPAVPGPTRPNAMRTAPTPGNALRTAPTPGNERVAKDAADEVAKKVSRIPGVKNAHVVVVGNVAMVGANLEANVEKGKTEQIRERAAKVAKADPRIVRTVVETDPDTVKRISNMAKGVRDGRPISEFFDQITEMFNRAKPTT